MTFMGFSERDLANLKMFMHENRIEDLRELISKLPKAKDLEARLLIVDRKGKQIGDQFSGTVKEFDGKVDPRTWNYLGIKRL